ncbi:hypothetical protein LCM23_07320 [Cytobacillus kochii]|uniref:hypothetical protein n=1 Tax=Cytobacillus kochii TaxID=859143 RepID=UPI001CD20A28|nr:hypothetical protein [Cytobacillus kochii]MCA1025899.1 hypothetical protein [Cytobacillus kochii]
MGTFLDSQSSQNSTANGQISIPVTATPALFGTLGLNLAGAGANPRVTFSISAAFTSLATVLTPIVVNVYRVVNGTPTLIYSATQTLAVAGLGVASTTVLSFNGADYNPIATTTFPIYRATINVGGGVVLFPTRTGPETFYAAAYSD